MLESEEHLNLTDLPLMRVSGPEARPTRRPLRGRGVGRPSLARASLGSATRCAGGSPSSVTSDRRPPPPSEVVTGIRCEPDPPPSAAGLTRPGVPGQLGQPGPPVQGASLSGPTRRRPNLTAPPDGEGCPAHEGNRYWHSARPVSRPSGRRGLRQVR